MSRQNVENKGILKMSKRMEKKGHRKRKGNKLGRKQEGKRKRRELTSNDDFESGNIPYISMHYATKHKEFRRKCLVCDNTRRETKSRTDDTTEKPF